MAQKNIAVVAADGRVARKVITEAVNRGWNVTAFGRKDANTGDARTYISPAGDFQAGAAQGRRRPTGAAIAGAAAALPAIIPVGT